MISVYLLLDCIYSSGLSVLHLGLKLVSEVINAYIFVQVDLNFVFSSFSFNPHSLKRFIKTAFKNWACFSDTQWQMVSSA